MFEKWGRKLAKGVKQEIMTDKEGEGPITGLLSALVKIGILGVALLAGVSGGNKKNQGPTTVIVNNYICKEDLK